MLSFLSNILEAIASVPVFILSAIEGLINLFFEGITAIFTAATSLIPLPSVPSPPEFIAEINWFFPVGAIISIMVPIVVGYVAFLAIRWVFKWAGEL